MIATALILLLVAYLPGAAAIRIPAGDRPRRERLDAEERVFWGVVISVAWSLVVAFTLAALHRYSLTRLLEVNGFIVLAVVAGWRDRLRYAAAVRVSPTAAVPLALLVLCGALYPPPAEYILGGKDPGVYVNAGIQIAQRGRLVTIDETARSVPDDARPLFFPQYVNQPYFSPRFMGFFLLDPDRGTVVDQFPQLYPAGIAIGYGVDGLTGARYVGVLAAALGVLALYFLGTRLAGRTAGAAAAALLAINVLEVWYARYPNSEMMAQALGLAALLATARAHVDEDPFFAPVAGACLGLLPFVRFDAVLVAGLATAGVVLHWMAGGRLRAWFLIPLGAGGAAFAIYLVGWLTPYAALPRIWVDVHRTSLAAGMVLALVVLAVAARLRHQPRVRAAIVVWTPRFFLAIALGLAVYAWFFRQPGGALAAHDAFAFRTFGWYVAPPAIALAALGLALLLLGRFWTDPSFFVAFLGVSIFVFDRLHIVPDHFWAARRFVMLILPGVVLSIAAALAPVKVRAGVPGARASMLVRQLVRFCLLALVAASFWSATRPILSHVEYAGVIPQVEKLAARFGENDLLVVESRDASDLHVIALPLAYIYAKNVLVLANPKPDSLRFARFLSWARSKYLRRLLPRRRWHRSALAPGRRRARGQRAISGARVRVAAQRVSDSRAAERVRLRDLPLRRSGHASAGARLRHRRDGRSVRRSIPRERTGRERHVPLDRAAIVSVAGRRARRRARAGDLDGKRRTVAEGAPRRGRSVCRRPHAGKVRGGQPAAPLRVPDPCGPGCRAVARRRCGDSAPGQHNVESPRADWRQRRPRFGCYGGPGGDPARAGVSLIPHVRRPGHPEPP